MIVAVLLPIRMEHSIPYICNIAEGILVFEIYEIIENY